MEKSIQKILRSHNNPEGAARKILGETNEAKLSVDNMDKRSEQAVRNFLPAAEELRVAAKNDPNLDQFMAGKLGPKWRKKFSEIISRLD